MPDSYSNGLSNIRNLIDLFLNERFDAKAEKLAPDDLKYQALVEQFQRGNWLNDAARRVSQLQVVTHSLKPIHPDAKGSNLYVPPESLATHKAVGSHVLPTDFDGDVVGNAAALDVYKFLKLEYEGKSLLERVLEEDAELARALSDNAEQSQAWMKAFSGITEPRGEHASHTLAKQMYWLTGEDAVDNDDFHLLAPLYATSLAHHVFQTINHDRFSDVAKEARKAKREERLSEQEVHAYPDIATQKMGGTKPQNISQLNSERGGNNYLLASLPPQWEKRETSPPYGVISIFERFERLGSVRRLLSHLSWFLNSDPSPNLHTRSKIDWINSSLIDEMVLFAARIQEIEPGWSAREQCLLPDSEAFWLDPGRAQDDSHFHEGRKNTDWPNEIINRFANWLNAALGHRLPVGDVEFHHWKQELRQNASYQRQLDRDRRWVTSLEKELSDWLKGLEDA
ncbi:type I-F CRISPR-associated protein Csy1 [Chromohalobacter canadensis]|uniref:type I-F CRISPR-associated protein Csy1 n=1 Tax=Chromohalobacter canadensis TaxID=141389 RepID=UPI0024104B90|nr:type I-F CRISPR-associated protein Csy1 [Chromohalobacter canadensis]